MAHQLVQDVYGFYNGDGPPPIESYPVRLPRVLSPTDLQFFRHASIDATREIRLLELLPPKRKKEKNSNDLIKCRLSTHSLPQVPHFEALSYTWGQIERHLPLSIVRQNEDGQDVEEAVFATPQLLMALRRLRHPSQSRLIWVDQLCINQDDNVEKSQQIQLMGQIYRAATQVVIWLGEDPEFYLEDLPGVTATYGQLMEEVLQVMTTCGENESRRFEIARDSFDVRFAWHKTTITERRVEMVKDVLQRPWFTRAWVFQEASLARTLRIQYGSIELSFDALRSLCDAIVEVEHDIGVYRNIGLPIETAGFQMMRLIEQCRNASPTDHGTSSGPPGQRSLLQLLLPVLRRVRCQDPRDLIFAFLAFQQNEGISAVEGITKPVDEVWRDAATRIIQASKSLDIFAALSGDKERNITLPSWVPYWADCLPYGRPIAAPGGTSFRASRDKPHIWVTCSDTKTLIVKGKIIDEIDGNPNLFQGPSLPFDRFQSDVFTTDFFLNMGVGVQNMRGHYYQHSETYGHHLQTKLQTAEHDYLRICLADGTLDARQPLGEKLFDLFDLNAQSESIQELRNTKNRSNMTADERSLVDQYEEFENLCLIAEYKQLFATKWHQHGMAPMGIQTGDKIAILHGSRTPCVLRVVNEAKSEYKIISQCYLDGWMHGEPRANIPRPHPHQRWWEQEQDEFILV